MANRLEQMALACVLVSLQAQAEDAEIGVRGQGIRLRANPTLRDGDAAKHPPAIAKPDPEREMEGNPESEAAVAAASLVKWRRVSEETVAATMVKQRRPYARMQPKWLLRPVEIAAVWHRAAPVATGVAVAEHGMPL